jgi:hypothetical protein
MLDLLLRVIVEQRNWVVRSGAVVKEVRCEDCGGEYVYLMKRTASSGGFNSKETSARMADLRLEPILKKEFDVVPCPSCGWYQEAMVLRAKQQAAKDRYLLGWILMGLFSFFAFPPLLSTLFRERLDELQGNLVLGSLGICGFLAGFLIWLSSHWQFTRCDPNAADKDERIRLGQSLSRRKEDVAHLLAELGSDPISETDAPGRQDPGEGRSS